MEISLSTIDKNFIRLNFLKNVVKVNGEIIERHLLEQFDIPTFVTKIGDFVFHKCESLISIIIPSSVSEIGFCAF